MDADFFNETRLSDFFMSETRLNYKILGETEMRLCDFFMSETRLNSKTPGETVNRLRVSVSFFMRPRGEPTFYKEKDCIFG